MRQGEGWESDGGLGGNGQLVVGYGGGAATDSCFAALSLPQQVQPTVANHAECRPKSVTFVVLNWSRLPKVITLLHRAHEQAVITEVILWNNNPLDSEAIERLRSQKLIGPKVKIIHSPTNLMDRAKYEACMQVRRPSNP